MDFRLDEDHVMLRDMAREFAARGVSDDSAARDHDGRFDPALRAAAAELGLFGVCVPESQGGAGMDPLALSVALEEIASADAGLAMVLATHARVCALLAERGDERLPALAAGDQIGAWVEGNGRGVVGAAVADVLVVVTEAGPTLHAAGDLEITPRPDRLGLRSGACADVSLPGGAPVSSGAHRALYDAAVAAVAVGVARAALDAGATYATERKQFGKPIATFQAIQWKIADSATDLEAARLLAWRAATAGDAATAAMARAFAAEAAVTVADHAVQTHGGYGYTREYPVERLLRDARAITVADGPPRALKQRVAEAQLPD
jgi:alkylation response protein AidB-like acyl-CoA dehydrogenase